MAAESKKRCIWRRYEPFIQAYPEGKHVYGPVLKGGCENPVGIRMASERGWLRTFISKDSKNIDACLRLIDYLMSEEGNRFAQYGVEGEHYKWEGEKLVRLIDDEKTNELDLNKFLLAIPYYLIILLMSCLMHSSSLTQSAHQIRQTVFSLMS